MVEHYTHEYIHTMSEDKKKYICKLPTNGYQSGDEAMLTDAEAANFNGGEPVARFVLAEGAGVVDAPGDAEKSSEEVTPPAEVTPPSTPNATGEYTGSEEDGTGAPMNTETVSGTSEEGVQ